MSFVKILPEYLEKFTLTLHPETRYHSSSFQGPTTYPTGSMPLSPRPSKCLKNTYDPSQKGQNSYDSGSPGVEGLNMGDYDLLTQLQSAQNEVNYSMAQGVSANVSNTMNSYMELVNSSSEIARNTKRFEIVRFDPPFSFTLNSSVKNCIRKVLMPYYSSFYDVCQFSFTNYNTINFFTSSTVPTKSAIIYNNFKFPGRPRPYSPTGSFSFDFYINPRYGSDLGSEFHAGTIMHLTSTFALSLVSGTLKDGDGSTDGYRLLLQLSHSADTAPSKVDLSIANNKRPWPDNLTFLSSDNSLRKNKWHHVCVRWGGSIFNDGSGSFIIDGKDDGTFNVPSASILPAPHVNCSALVLGNYYEASGEGSAGDEARFFNKVSCVAQGAYPWEDFGGGSNEDPTDFKFNHPLNAEIHDVKIFNKYLTGKEIQENSKYGQSSVSGDLMFYAPPFFVQESPVREVILTPFQTETKQSKSPFNVNFSFGVGGYLINLQNYLRDFSTGFYPRLYCLTASTIDSTVLDITANGYVYASGSTRKRNLTILPNDNGLFAPDFALLNSGSSEMSVFKSVHGGTDLSLVNIDDMVPSGAAYSGIPTVALKTLIEAINNAVSELQDDVSADTIAAEIAGVTPENMGSTVSTTGPILTVYQRTRDPSSNEISIFDISNLFYGDRILPGSFYLTDPNITGSGNKVKMTLRDNKRGGLYRADSLTQHATWSNVGTILYPDGVAVVKSPHIAYFGQDRFEATFKGEQDLHIMTLNIPAEAGLINSSSNPRYMQLSASNNANDVNQNFVYVSGFNLHDDNLNVIMRGTLAQPVLKRERDEFLLRFKMDF